MPTTHFQQPLPYSFTIFRSSRHLCEEIRNQLSPRTTTKRTTTKRTMTTLSPHRRKSVQRRWSFSVVLSHKAPDQFHFIAPTANVLSLIISRLLLLTPWQTCFLYHLSLHRYWSPSPYVYTRLHAILFIFKFPIHIRSHYSVQAGI